MPKRKVLTHADRKVARAGKGTLKSRHISMRCRRRYEEAIQFVFAYLPLVAGCWASDWENRDQQLATFLETMYAEGGPKSLAGDILSGLQWHYTAC